MNLLEEWMGSNRPTVDIQKDKVVVDWGSASTFGTDENMEFNIELRSLNKNKNMARKVQKKNFGEIQIQSRYKNLDLRCMEWTVEIKLSVKIEKGKHS